MTWHIANAIEHGEIRNALFAQTLHQPIAGAGGSHADAGQAQISH
jgi:hypothetical protein